MSNYEIDVERQPMITNEPLASSKSNISCDLSTYQTLIGDIDAPPSPVNALDTYHMMLAEERSASRWFYVSATLLYPDHCSNRSMSWHRSWLSTRGDYG
jgi:hypothetical protein